MFDIVWNLKKKKKKKKMLNRLNEDQEQGQKHCKIGIKKVKLSSVVRLTDWTLFLNGEDISTKVDSHICRCYNATNNQDIHSEILLLKDIDKYSISKN